MNTLNNPVTAKRETIHIVSDYRSISTLLDQVLGAHPSICNVGEVHNLRAYVLRNMSLHDPAYPLVCTSGIEASECPFWRDVQADVGIALNNLSLKFGSTALALSSPQAGRVRRRLRRLLETIFWAPVSKPVRPLLFQSAVVQDNEKLYSSIHQVSGCCFIVDSSKSLLRCGVLFDVDMSTSLAILLYRDYCGVVFSKMSRGGGLEEGARSSVSRLREMEKLLARIPAGRILRVRLKDRCSNRDHILQRICRFLGVKYHREMTRQPNDNVHQIGRSPSTFARERPDIPLDTTYQNAFSSHELDVMHDTVADTARNRVYE